MEDKKIKWYMLAFMAFSTVWGFGNVVNGFVYFNGIQVIFSWLFMFGLYFVPYALMVGELGSAFKDSGGGVSSWIYCTIGPKAAYFAGWTYWACHITYIASKCSGGLKAFSWLVSGNGNVFNLPTHYIQIISFAILVLFCWIATKGLNPLKKLATIAGTSMFIMSLLYILMMFAAPAINPDASFVSLNFNLKSLIPNFNVGYFTSLSILVFAVGGCEKMSPYVNKVENPSKGFPKGMIALAIMVAVCAFLGTIAMGMMFDPSVINANEENFNLYVGNGAYMAFEQLGQYYHVGSLLMRIYAACNMVGQLSTLVVSIDAPLRMLLDNEESREFIPTKLLKQNENGAYVNGIKLVLALSGSIVLVQALAGILGLGSIDFVIQQLNKLNSVCMPMRYLWVFAAYVALRWHADKHGTPEYRFTKNNTLAIAAGVWCFAVTAICCLLGVWSTNMATLCLNIVTPIILTCLGFILPAIKKREKQ